MMALAYGFLCYGLFLATFVYAVGFIANLGVPRSIDVGPESPVGWAVAGNVALLALFAVQHSVMARPGFKRWWIRFVPAPLERSTYVLASSVVFIALFVFWRPIDGTIWEITHPIGEVLLLGGYFVGVGLILYATFLIDHFDLFGLRQVVLHARGKPITPKAFVTPSLYRYVRHPLYVGWFLAVWLTPEMSVGHLLFAIGCTGYILAAVPLEERDLGEALGDDYRSWRARTPAYVPRRRLARPRHANAQG